MDIVEDLNRTASGWATPYSDLLERAAKEIEALRAFAQAVMEVWPMGDLDGGDLQELATKHGMLKPETRHEPCGEVCSCNEYADPDEWVDGVVCYRKTPLLKGSNVELTGAARLYRAASSDRRERG